MQCVKQAFAASMLAACALGSGEKKMLELNLGVRTKPTQSHPKLALALSRKYSNAKLKVELILTIDSYCF